MVYVIVEMQEGSPQDLIEEILDAISAGDWYTSALGALATADQYNQDVIDRITEEEYAEGNFTLMGVVKLGYEGLVSAYDY